MKRVYQLDTELKMDPRRKEMTQALTLNTSKPAMGLRGTHGLFASDEWWENIRLKKMPLLFLSGVVQRAYVAGQDESSDNDTVDVLLKDGSVRSVGIYTNVASDVALFRVGARASIVYALDELKKQPGPDGGVNYSKVALEMTISTAQN